MSGCKRLTLVLGKGSLLLKSGNRSQKLFAAFMKIQLGMRH
jgi:hypothetical protein